LLCRLLWLSSALLVDLEMTPFRIIIHKVTTIPVTETRVERFIVRKDGLIQRGMKPRIFYPDILVSGILLFNRNILPVLNIVLDEKLPLRMCRLLLKVMSSCG
jgi:hypothetical protein